MVTQNSSDSLWANRSDEELLKIRICDFNLEIEGSELAPRIDKLYKELESKGIFFKPTCYLTTEWLCPDKIPMIGIPFCLAHPRLKQLERNMMLEVEGGTETTCIQLLRHEMGHAINYAYRLYRRTRWRELFGPFSTEYNEHNYYSRPYSKQYVLHLPDNYAQAHPDEDFAETFSVWLTPNLDWQKKYKGWGAIKKLEYVNHLMKQIGSTSPLVTRGQKLWAIHRLRSTLATYYKKKREEFAETYAGYYDPDLLKIFAPEPKETHVKADRFLRQHQRILTDTVAQWAHARKYAIDHLVRRLANRSKELSLYIKGEEKETLLHIGVYLTTLICEQRDVKAQHNP